MQAQGEHPKATEERVFSGRGLPPDTRAPSVNVEQLTAAGAALRARIHDYKSPSLPFEWKRVVVEWQTPGGTREVAMDWYGEYLWRAKRPADVAASATARVCATDAAGNTTCR